MPAPDHAAASPHPHAWFPSARYGLFVHFGPYAAHGHGEQVLFREQRDQEAYQAMACAWDPHVFDARELARQARLGGYRYVVFTTRHHDGYCLWDSALTDYSSAQQAPRRDLVREVVEAVRAEGLRIGLYYSLLDWRLPAYWRGPERDPEGWRRVLGYVHGQVQELLTGYGRIDLMWFDGAWPRSAEDWQSRQLITMIRQLQPGILINNRLGVVTAGDATGTPSADGGLGAGESRVLGDYGTPEHAIHPEVGRMWESCQTTIWRLWGHVHGQRWKDAAQWLDLLVETASKGGNLLLNLGPGPDGSLPAAWLQANAALGVWLDRHGEAVYEAEGGNVTESVTHGWQTTRGTHLYLIDRWHDPHERQRRLVGLASRVLAVQHLTRDQPLAFSQDGDVLLIDDLPVDPGTDLFPVIRITCAERPRASVRGSNRLWSGDPALFIEWAAARGEGPLVDGSWPKTAGNTRAPT